MGACCSQQDQGSRQPETEILQNNGQIQVKAQPQKTDETDPEMEKGVIKIQSQFRGQKARKEVQEKKQQVTQIKVENQVEALQVEQQISVQESAQEPQQFQQQVEYKIELPQIIEESPQKIPDEPTADKAEQVNDFPDINNDLVKAVYKKLGPYLKDQDLQNFPTYKFLQGNDHYQGQFKQGQKNGIGKILFGNGMIYEGYWQNDRMEGQGRFIYPDGEYYIGEWSEGRKNGKGEQHSTDDDVIYQGQFKDDKKHGLGTQVHKDGTKYEGEFEVGVKSGQGKLEAKDLIYEGSFKNDQFNGDGEITWVSKGKSYKGNFVDGKRSGFGKQTHFNKDKKVIKIHEGQWLNDEAHGEGKIWNHEKWQNGTWNNGKHMQWQG